MNKKAITPLIIVLIVLAIVGIGAVYMQSVQTASSGDGFIKVRLYDANGNPITPSLSIVNNVEGVSYIDLTITATSTGSVPLSCDLVATETKVNSQIPPNVFSQALVTGNKLLNGVGAKAEWTTNLIAVSSLEGTPSPDVFSTMVRCSYTDAQGTHYIDQTGSVSITITSAGSTGFTVNVDSGGLPSKWCGDTVCDAGIGETSISCPADCGGTLAPVNFRTNDVSYPFGSAIGYNSGTCGGALTQYGWDTTSCLTVTDATCPTITGYTRALSTKTVPGKPLWAGTNTACLYTKDADATIMRMGWKVSTTAGSPCGTVGQWGLVNFNTASTYKTKVSTSGTSFNPSKEVTC